MKTAIIKIFKYFFNKRSEIYDLDFKDALLAQANARIYRKRKHKSKKMVLLKHLKPIHGLDRENAQQVLDKRKRELEENREHILINNEIRMDVFMKYLPSISFIRVVEANSMNYLAFEGNGRIAALKEVLANKGNTIKSRVVSIFDTTARPIKKGKLGVKAEFGNKVIV
jgi:hypothetical protein